MSLPFFTRKADARRLWGPNEKLRKVWVRGGKYLQAAEDGYYWVTVDMARGLHFPSKRPKSRPKRRAKRGK